MEKGQGKGTDTLQTDNVFTHKEYIERKAALSFPFANGQYDHENADRHFINGCESYREWLEAVPAADVVPVRHGKWETAFLAHEYLGCRPYAHYCSVCHQIIAFRTFYCPNCGAKMDKGGDGNG